jgi:hypothetical protein
MAPSVQSSHLAKKHSGRQGKGKFFAKQEKTTLLKSFFQTREKREELPEKIAGYRKDRTEADAGKKKRKGSIQDLDCGEKYQKCKGRGKR